MNGWALQRNLQGTTHTRAFRLLRTYVSINIQIDPSIMYSCGNFFKVNFLKLSFIFGFGFSFLKAEIYISQKKHCNI